MITRVLTTADTDAWRNCLARLPGADVYHTPEYHAAHEANGDGTAFCFVAEDGDNLLLHPFMLRDVGGTGYRDIETVYGYSGPLATERLNDGAFIGAAWATFGDWCHARGVVAEFVRFNPLSANYQVVSWRCLNRIDRYTVVLDLAVPPGDSYTPTARNKIRKAQRWGLTVADLPAWACLGEDGPFQCLYRRAMERNGADDYYRFSPAYFQVIRMGMGGRLRLFGVQTSDGKVIAASLVLIHGDRMHYHLTGSDDSARDSGAGNLLIHAAAEWGRANGYRWLHLGGGRTAAPDDALLRFKASMSPLRRPFYTGRRVHNPAAYERLCSDWMLRHGAVERPDYFLLWRKQ